MPATARPHVVFITVDQWRGDLSPGLGGWLSTPRLDALAREATVFSRHYAQAYPCGPARAGLITGLYPHKHRSIQNGTPLDARHRTIFQAARGAGYAPVLFGYTDTAPDPRGLAKTDPARSNYEGVAQGLDVGCLLDGKARPWIADLLRKGYPVADPAAGREGVFALRPFGCPTVFDSDDTETAFLTDRIIDHINTQGSEPLFLHASFIAPHPPFAATAKWLDAIDSDKIPYPRRLAENLSDHPLLAAYRKGLDLSHFAPGVGGPPHMATPEVIRTIRHAYAALAAEVDHHLGRIIDTLHARGIWDNTIFIFAGDHGEQLFEHGLLGKLGWYDASAHIPLIIRLPSQKTGYKIDAFTQSIDIFPTLVGLLGLEGDVNLDGVSLQPWLEGQAPVWRDGVTWSHDFRNIANLGFEKHLGLPSRACNLQVIRTERFKYVHFPSLPPVLYDLADDPAETINRVDDPAYAAVRLEGVERLLNMRLMHENEELSCYQAVDGELHGSRYR